MNTNFAKFVLFVVVSCVLATGCCVAVLYTIGQADHTTGLVPDELVLTRGPKSCVGWSSCATGWLIIQHDHLYSDTKADLVTIRPVKPDAFGLPIMALADTDYDGIFDYLYGCDMDKWDGKSIFEHDEITLYKRADISDSRLRACDFTCSWWLTTDLTSHLR